MALSTSLRTPVVATDEARGGHRNPETLRGCEVTPVASRVIKYFISFLGYWHWQQWLFEVARLFPEVVNCL